MRTADLGFEKENMLTSRIGVFESAYPEEADRIRFWESLVEKLAAAPGAVSAAATSSLPSIGRGGTFFRLEGKEYVKTCQAPTSPRSARSCSTLRHPAARRQSLHRP